MFAKWQNELLTGKHASQAEDGLLKKEMSLYTDIFKKTVI